MMMRDVWRRLQIGAAGLALALVNSALPAHAQPKIQYLPNMGQQVTPLAPQGSRFAPMDPELAYDPALLAGQGWLASQAVTTVVSPDHKTLLALTSGYNRISNINIVPPAGVPTWYIPASTEYVFIYDISISPPSKQPQVLKIPNTYSGMVFDPSGAAFYVSGGPSDNIHVVTRSADGGPGRATVRRRRGYFKRWPDAGGGELLQRLDHDLSGRLGQLGAMERTRPSPRLERRIAVWRARRRLSVLGSSERNRRKHGSLYLQHSRPRNRGSEPERAAGADESSRKAIGGDPNPCEGPTQ